jgi:hypothetical protein
MRAANGRIGSNKIFRGSEHWIGLHAMSRFHQSDSQLSSSVAERGARAAARADIDQASRADSMAEPTALFAMTLIR